MKKIFLWSVTILEVILLLGAYIFNYFTKKKMGMARHVIYKNQVFEKTLPIELLIYGSCILVIILTIAIIFYFFKSEKIKTKVNYIDMLLTLVLSIFFLGFMLLKSATEIRAYYFIGMFFFLAIFLQIIKTYISLIKSKYEK